MRNELHEFWISIKLIHTFVLVTKATSLGVNEDERSVPLSPLDSAANGHHRLQRAHIAVTQIRERRNPQTLFLCDIGNYLPRVAGSGDCSSFRTTNPPMT